MLEISEAVLHVEWAQRLVLTCWFSVHYSGSRDPTGSLSPKKQKETFYMSPPEAGRGASVPINKVFGSLEISFVSLTLLTHGPGQN